MNKLVVLAAAAASIGWIYPEHRDIAAAGFDRLSAADRAALEKVWAEARKGNEERWCEKMAAGDQGPTPPCIDFAAWPAIAGDHSCSPQNLMAAVVPSDWILRVAAVAADTKAALASAGSRVATLNAIATSNLALQKADPEYATRAGANNAHFVLPKKRGETDYFRTATAQGAPLNALGLFVQYHLAAVVAAHALGTTPPTDAARTDRARLVISLAAFSLHWIEDAYAAGHVVGSWGDTAWRKGTHDYYSEFGVDTVNWDGKSVVMFGDANMKPADLDRTSAHVARALHDVAAAVSPGDPLAESARGFGPGAGTMFSFDSCKEELQPTDQGRDRILTSYWTGLGAMPVAVRGEGDVHPPRFRDELGPFLGVFASLTGGGTWGGVAPTLRAQGTIAAGARFGFGLEGVTGSVGTGLIFVEGGLELAGSQLDACKDAACSGLGATGLFPRVPARSGLRLGIRMPFWILPFDMLVLAPLLFAISPRTLSNVGVEAASGGWLPYERSVRTSAGIFQFIAGREVQATLYGYLGDRTIPLMIVPVDQAATQYGVLQLKSLNLWFPVFEYTPFRTFATQIAFGLALQAGFGVEIPLSREMAAPAGATPPTIGTTWTIFLRMQADGRYFFGSREDLSPPKG